MTYSTQTIKEPVQFPTVETHSGLDRVGLGLVGFHFLSSPPVGLGLSRYPWIPGAQDFLIVWNKDIIVN